MTRLRSGDRLGSFATKLLSPDVSAPGDRGRAHDFPTGRAAADQHGSVDLAEAIISFLAPA